MNHIVCRLAVVFGIWFAFTAPAFAEEKDSLNGSSKSIFGIFEGADMKLSL